MKYIISASCMLLLLPLAASAHVIVNELSQLSAGTLAWEYLKLGYKHILPLGLDHILFILSLLLLSPKLKPLILQTSAFTVAHSITLALSLYGVVQPSPKIIEPLIALSILFVALENIFSAELKPARLLIVFAFGLIHGMGFASALTSLGLPKNNYLLGILMFNLGVELGQLTVILTVYLVLIKWLSKRTGYRKSFVIPISVIIAIVAICWTIQRIVV